MNELTTKNIEQQLAEAEAGLQSAIEHLAERRAAKILEDSLKSTLQRMIDARLNPDEGSDEVKSPDKVD